MVNYLKKSKIVEVKGEKVGLIGASPVDMFKRATHPEYHEDCHVDAMEETIDDIQEEVEELRYSSYKIANESKKYKYIGLIKYEKNGNDYKTSRTGLIRIESDHKDYVQKMNTEGTVLIDEQGFKIVAQEAELDVEGEKEYNCWFYLENNTDKGTWFQIEKMSVNGFVIKTSTMPRDYVPANTKGYKSILFTEDDIDMLEDVIIENKQAAEMVEMHRTILESMMDCMASIISVVIYSFERIAVSEIKAATSQSKIVEIAPRRSRLIFVIPRST